MRRISRVWVAAFAAVLMAAGTAWAQENNEGAKQAPVPTNAAPGRTGPFYHLDFVVKELDGSNKVINSRSYSTSISISQKGFNSIRAGARVPVATVSINGDGKNPVQTQYQYVDVGVNFDCRDLHEAEGKLSLKVGAEVSSIEPNEKDGQLESQPTIRQNKWDADVIVPFGKPTTIFSSDDVSSKSKIQVELTATLIK